MAMPASPDPVSRLHRLVEDATLNNSEDVISLVADFVELRREILHESASRFHQLCVKDAEDKMALKLGDYFALLSIVIGEA